MQTREQVKNWKVVASMATVAALGVTGLAVASPGEPADTPPPIEIQDARDINSTFTTTSQPAFEVVPAPSFDVGDDTLDTPLASADTSDSPDSPSTTADTEDSPDSPSAPADTDDSPDTSSAPADTDDSPDTSSVDDSADSADSLDS